MRFAIGELSEIDIPRIMRIEHASFASDVCEEADIYLKRMMLFPAGNIGFFTEGELMGFLCAERWTYQDHYEPERFSLSHDAAAYHDERGDELYIASFAIDPARRHLVRGKNAFDKAMNYLGTIEGATSAILLVAEHWTVARHIYLWRGFEETSRLPKFFDETSDGIIMRAMLRLM